MTPFFIQTNYRNCFFAEKDFDSTFHWKPIPDELISIEFISLSNDFLECRLWIEYATKSKTNKNPPCIKRLFPYPLNWSFLLIFVLAELLNNNPPAI